MKKGLPIKPYKKKKDLIRAIACVSALWLLVLCVWKLPLVVQAGDETGGKKDGNKVTSYSSWAEDVPEYQNIYGNNSTTGNGGTSLYDGINQTGLDINGMQGGDFMQTIEQWISPTQWVSELVGGIFILLGGVVNGILGGRIGNDVTSAIFNLGHVDLTMDSVIFGRLLNNHPVNYVTWELHSGNVYGVLSAFLYRFLWDIAFSAFVLVFFIMLIRQLTSGGDAKKRAELKDSLTHGLLIFLMLYLIPQIADISVYLRDWLLKSIYVLMAGDNNVTNLSYTNIFMAQWARLPWYEDGADVGGVGGFAMGILFFAASCAGMIFAIDYIRIAIKQTALFGLFPVFAILSLKNKKILSNWLVEFIPNLFIPVIDGVLLLLPCMVIRFANTQGLTGWSGIGERLLTTGGGLDIGIFLIVCIMIFSVIPLRKEVLKLIGQANPMGGSRGFGGVMAAGMMAMRMMGRTGGVPSGIENYGGMSVADNLAMANALEGYGTAGATAMAAATADNLSSIEKTTEIVGDKFAESAEASASSSMDISQDMAEGNPPMMTDSMGETGDTLTTSGTISAGEEGYDYTVDAFDPRVSEDMDNMSAEMETGEFYRDKMFTPTREENLEQMEAYQGLMAKTQQDIDTLSAENGYDKALLARYESLGQDIEHAKAGGGLGIVDGSTGKPIGSSTAHIDAMEREREGIEKQMQSRIASYQPQTKQAADGAPLNNKDGRIRPESVAAKSGDLQGQMKEVIKDRESQIADNRKAYNEQKAAYEQAKRSEAAFAKEAKAYGSSGETFDSAEAYRKHREVDAVFKQAANYKNFDTKGISEHLDPATRAKMYRMRAQKQMETEAGVRKQKALTAIGAGAGAVIGGSAMMFGGEQAAMSGAMMGGMMGAMGAKGASNPAKAARKEEMKRRAELGPNENPHKTKITIHPKRVGIEGIRKIEAGSGTNRPESRSVQIKREAGEKEQKATAAQSEAKKKLEGEWRGERGEKLKSMGDQMIDAAGAKKGGSGKPKA